MLRGEMAAPGLGIIAKKYSTRRSVKLMESSLLKSVISKFSKSANDFTERSVSGGG